MPSGSDETGENDGTGDKALSDDHYRHGLTCPSSLSTRYPGFQVDG